MMKGSLTYAPSIIEDFASKVELGRRRKKSTLLNQSECGVYSFITLWCRPLIPKGPKLIFQQVLHQDFAS